MAQDTEYFELSLLYPNIESKNISILKDGLSEQTAEQLELYGLINLSQSNLGDFFTGDAKVIEYRQKTFADLIEYPDLCDTLSGMLPYLSDISELRQIGSSLGDAADGYLYSISEIEIYVSLMNYLKDELLPYNDKVESEALKSFCRRIKELTEGEYYKNLTEKLSELASRVRDIRSFTIGVNVDGKMTVESAGVVSVNGDKFKSGDFLEKVKRLDFKNDDMTFLSNLIPFAKGQGENQKIAFTNAINNAISDIFKSSIKAWKSAIQLYVLENTDFLMGLVPEIEFLIEGAKLCRSLSKRGAVLTNPAITNNGELHAEGLINPVIALKTDGELVANSIDFDENAMIYVITGPNRGGKSVMTCAVGIAVAMAQLGLPVPCLRLELSPVDKILTHFPTGSEDTVEKGRLGEECARLGEIFDKVTSQSLILLDESLSSTGSYEGAYIASEVLTGFSLAGCRCIFSTHLHDLAASVKSINEECVPRGGVKIDNLVAEVSEGARTFRIIKAMPDGKSYARDIAEKYGLSAEKILEKISFNKK